MRHRWLLVLGCIIGLTLVVTLTVFFLALGAPTPAYSAADASWAACPSSAATAASLEELPPELLAQMGLPAPALGDVGQGWCEGCTCFRGCVWGVWWADDAGASVDLSRVSACLRMCPSPA